MDFKAFRLIWNGFWTVFGRVRPSRARGELFSEAHAGGGGRLRRDVLSANASRLQEVGEKAFDCLPCAS